jgi:hypothetical protein
MMNKKDVCVIISSYPQTSIDHSLLGLTIESWKQQGYDICLVSHTPLNPDTQKASKYFIYTDENEMLTFPDSSNTTWFYGTGEFLYQTNWGNTMGKHSYAILKNIQNTLHFLKLKSYTHFIYLEIDGFLNHENHKTLEKHLDEIEFLGLDYWLMMEYNDLASLPVTNFFGGRISYFLRRLLPFNTPEKYMEVSKGGGGYSLESFFGQIFVRNKEGKGYIVYDAPRNVFPNDWFGISMNGQVYVPGLKHKDWWLDLVKDKVNNDIIYAIVTQSQHEFEGVLKIYEDDIVTASIDITTGPFIWFRIDKKTTKKWKLEHVIKNEVVKKVEYTTDEIISNDWSFLQLN